MTSLPLDGDDDKVSYYDDDEVCCHDHDEDCEADGCHHEHCPWCGGCGCPGYCDDYQTYNLRPSETGWLRSG